jgi:uncharacterized surface protein with fasciclin (FAS1) repeats
MNLNRFLTFMKRALFVCVVLTTAGLTGCDDNKDTPTGPTVFNGTVAALIGDAQFKESATVSADVALDSLAKYISAYPELTTVLGGSNEITLFAPSNTAFKNLLNTNGFPKDIRLISPDLIKGVLAYHIVSGKKLKADLTAGTELSTMFTDPLSPAAPQKIKVNANGTLIAAPNATNIDIDMVKTDVLASNGVVHVTESVLIPPSTGAVLVPILGTVAGTVLLGKDFSNLAKIILSADANFTEVPGEGKFKITTWLAMPISSAAKATANLKGITFFAPPNAVPGANVLTAEIANSIIAGSDDKGRSFVLNHLVTAGIYTVAPAPATNPLGITSFPEGLSTLSTKGKGVVINRGAASAQNPYGVALTNKVEPQSTDFRPIVSKDLSHSNGVIQVYAGLLMN